MMFETRFDTGKSTVVETRFDVALDVRGLQCPRPLLKMKEALYGLQPGQILKVIATDKATKATFPPFLRRSGDILLAVEESGGELHHYVEKR